jgi:hypothetical protein
MIAIAEINVENIGLTTENDDEDNCVDSVGRAETRGFVETVIEVDQAIENLVGIGRMTAVADVVTI